MATQTNRKICWIQHASETPLIKELIKALDIHDIDSYMVCKTRHAYESYQKDGVNALYVSDFFHSGKEFTQEEMVELDLKYGPPSLLEMSNSDLHLRHFFKNDTKGKLQLLSRMYEFWEKFFDTHKIACVLSRESSSFVARTAYTVCRKREIPFIQIFTGPDNNTFTLDDTREEHVWSELLDCLSKPRKLNKDEVAQVNEFITQRLPKPQGKMLMRFVPVSFFQTFKQILGLWRQDTKKNRNKDPVKVAAQRYGIELLMKRSLWRLITQNHFCYDKIKEEKFIYFPLYSGCETAYLANNHFWAVNEFDLIKEITNSLPLDCYLYVKEHPVNPGYFSYWQLKHLQKCPNIRIVHPQTSSQDLINKSQAVFVLQGTVGWEAFLSKKPVIALGRTFFTYSKLVYKLDDISDISSLIWKVLLVGDKIYEDNRDDWLWFIYSVIISSNKGVYVRVEPPYGFPEDEENATLMAQSILSKIERTISSA